MSRTSHGRKRPPVGSSHLPWEDLPREVPTVIPRVVPAGGATIPRKVGKVKVPTGGVKISGEVPREALSRKCRRRGGRGGWPRLGVWARVGVRVGLGWVGREVPNSPSKSHGSFPHPAGVPGVPRKSHRTREPKFEIMCKLTNQCVQSVSRTEYVHSKQIHAPKTQAAV